MSLIIKGMEMPQSCWRCKLKVGFSACGLVTDRKDGGLFYRVHNENSRPDWCPLLPLPEKHGRLGDLDSVKEKLLVAGVQAQLSGDPNAYLFAMGLKLAEEIVDGMDVVIEAEGGGEE